MLALFLAAQAAAAPAYPPTPTAIVAAATAAEWVTIAPEDLLVMELAPDMQGRPRRVVIQLIAAPFSAGWVANIRALAHAHWYDGTAVTRVQDNYVAQWGEPEGEDKAKAKPLPAGLNAPIEEAYTVPFDKVLGSSSLNIAGHPGDASFDSVEAVMRSVNEEWAQAYRKIGLGSASLRDGYAQVTGIWHGWPVAFGDDNRIWPVHCYATVGVGRELSPDTGTGAELYTVIGHAPRHLDRNIAVVGRVVEGIEHLSSLPRGSGALGVYATAGERTAIRSIRLASELAVGERPRLQYLSTDTASFAAYANTRANRHDAFFIQPAGGVDVCNVPVPIRRAP